MWCWCACWCVLHRPEALASQVPTDRAQKKGEDGEVLRGTSPFFFSCVHTVIGTGYGVHTNGGLQEKQERRSGLSVGSNSPVHVYGVLRW